MGLETATTISGLNRLWPLGTDGKNEGDDHLRLIKTVLQMQYAGDLFYGQRITPDRWVWNDKADGTGTDVAVMDETGKLALGMPFPVGASDSLYTAQNIIIAGTTNPTLAFNTYIDASGTPAWKNINAGFGAFISFSVIGEMTISFGTASVAAGAPTVPLTRYTFGKDGDLLTNGGISVFSDALFGLRQGGVFRYMQFTSADYIGCNYSTHEVHHYNNAGRCFWQRGDRFFMVDIQAAKPGGGQWADSSDQRIKNVLGDYTSGLAEILALQPRRFTFKGNDTSEEPVGEMPGPPPATPEIESKPVVPATVPYANSPHCDAATKGTEFVGLVVQEMEAAGVFPEMITQRAAYIDGQPVTDLRDIDTTPLIFALINAVKELSARLEEVEALVVP